MQNSGMAKTLQCRDAGFDCNAVIHGETVEEILQEVRPHAAQAHGVEVTPTMEDGLRQLITER